MRRGTLTAAVGILAVVCSSCAGSSHGTAAGLPGTTLLGPSGTSSGSVSPSPISPSTSPTTLPASARPVPPASGFGANWTTYHGDAEATGVQIAGTELLPSRRAWTSPNLDGQLYGEPLV